MTRQKPDKEPDDLGAAWSEAEAALPAGWTLLMVQGPLGGSRVTYKLGHEWSAIAAHIDAESVTGYGDAPAAALHALAARLREVK